MTEEQFEYSVPVIETDRTILRCHKPEDLADCAAMWGDLEVSRYIASKPLSRSEVWARLLRSIAHWQVMKYGLWVVESKESHEFLGQVGFFEHRRDVIPPHEGIPEAGWVFKLEAHGKGLATETMQAALGWADHNIDCDSTICLFDPDHKGSWRVAEKLGYMNASTVTFNGAPAVTMKRHRKAG